MRWRSTGWPCVFVCALILSGSGLAAQDDVGELLGQGLLRWKEGQSDQAVVLFEKALSLDPTDDAILTFLDGATSLEILRMVRSEDARISGIGRTLLALRRKPALARISDPARIQEAIAEVYAAEGQEAFELKIRYAALIGRNLVPGLVEKLADAEIENRALAQTWIVRIGPDAIPALLAASGHSSPVVRASVAQLLGARPLRHQYSAATLATLLETDEDEGVRKAAAASLATIVGGSAAPAKQYHFANADFLYSNPHKNEFSPSYYLPTIYHLRDDVVVGETVADFQVSERMAEQALHEALKLDPEYPIARELALCVDALQVVEYDTALALLADDADVMEVLGSQAGMMNYVRRARLFAADKETLYRSLGLALSDQNNQVAEKLLETVAATQRRGPTPRELTAALMEASSRPVRVRAAAILAGANPADLSSADRERVVSVLAEAVVNSGIRIAHKVMGSRDNANRFDGLFREINVESFSNSDNVEAGIIRAGQLPPDLILIDDQVPSGVAQGSITPINFFVQRIRKDPRTAEIPVVVVLDASAYDAKKDAYESAENRVYVVPSDIDRVTFKNTVVDPLFEDREDAKARAVALGALAANSLMALSASATAFPVASVVPALERSLLSRPDEIRLPCLVTLGNMRSEAASSAGPLSQVFAASENSVEIRATAMMALGKILDASSAPAPDAILRIIVAGKSEADLGLRYASWFAWSAAKAPAAADIEQLYEATPPGEGGADVN